VAAIEAFFRGGVHWHPVAPPGKDGQSFGATYDRPAIGCDQGFLFGALGGRQVTFASD